MHDDSFNKEVFRFGRNVLIGFLTFLNAFVPLSMDLYLPALPHMNEAFHCERWLTDLTLSLFMLFFGLSMLVWGALSDRYGRKPILTSGLLVYLGASIVCFFSTSIYMFIFGRVLQAIGSGAISSVSMAIIKDSFKGRMMETVLVLVQTMTTISPMVAPMVGAVLLQFTSWRGLFFLLALCAITALALSFYLKETIQSYTKGSVFSSVKRIGFVLQNKALRWLVILFAISIMPFMGYLTSSSFIYIKFFGLSEQQFSGFFAANGAIAMLGPILYSRLFRNWSRRFYLSLAFAVFSLVGILLYTFASNGPFWFLGCYSLVTLFSSSMRPLGTLLMMSQLDTDSGTVAALMGCSSLIFGSISMMLCSIDFGNPIFPVSAIAFSTGIVCFFMWQYMDGKKMYRDPTMS